MLHRSSIYALLLLIITSVSCTPTTTDNATDSTASHTSWSKNAVIYEVNVRQFSPEGTFNEVTNRLTDLKNMGVTILWLMPIHPIGELNRKGSLGSYYSIRDYKGINPEFGTDEDFRRLVQTAHSMDMKVILDWVANHTSWDHPWTQSNPEWYTVDDSGNFVPPVADWADVIDLNYDNQDLRESMIDALEYWVREFDIDGYRCDVADMVPVDFWETARERLDAIKPVFMLAEAETPALQAKAFDMGYGWTMHHVMNKVANGAPVSGIDSLVQVNRQKFPDHTYLMNFTSNHDENSWNGTEFERMGDGVKAFAVLSGTMEGMPLIYNGQEVGMDKRLSFFEKDSIDWSDSPMRAFYTILNTLKKDNSALWNGTAGSPMVVFSTPESPRLYAFHRSNDSSSVIVALNLSADSSTVNLDTSTLQYTYRDVFEGSQFTMSTYLSINMGPWEYKVYERINE